MKENFLEGKRILTLLNLSKKKHIQLVLSVITVNEIKAQFRKRAHKAIEVHNSIVNDKKGIIRVLRNLSEAKTILQKFPQIDDACAIFDKKIDKELKKSNVVVLDYPVMNIREVFDNYFKNKLPFGKIEKKHEFPDAFALAQLEEWCKGNKEKCIVFSTDKDILDYQSVNLNIPRDYEKFLSDYLEQINPKRKELLAKLFLSNSNYIDSEITKWLDDELDNFNLYYEHSNWLDVHSISVEKIAVVDKSYEVISLNDESIEIEISANVQIKVVINIDDENTGSYDDEDKVMRYRETTDLEIENDITLPLTANFYIVNENDFDEQCEITEINEGKKIELEVDSDYY